MVILVFSDDEETTLNRLLSVLEEQQLVEYSCESALNVPKILCFHELTVKPQQRIVIYKGDEIQLTAREFDLLYFLASHPKQVFTLKQIYEGTTREEYHDTFRSMESSLYRLRKKLDNNYIENVRGYGYRFEPDIRR